MTRVSRWLVHTCTIARPEATGNVDPFNTPEEKLSVKPLLEDVPCRLHNIAPASRPVEIWNPTVQEAVQAEYNLYLDQPQEELTTHDVIVEVKDAAGKLLAEFPLDIILVVPRYGRTGREEFIILYAKRRGRP